MEVIQIWGVSVRSYGHTPKSGIGHGDSQRTKILDLLNKVGRSVFFFAGGARKKKHYIPPFIEMIQNIRFNYFANYCASGSGA